MDKRILKKISKEWCQGILLACGMDSFEEVFKEDLLTYEEVGYIVDEAHRIAERLTPEEPIYNLTDIVKKYYEFPNESKEQ